MAAVASLQVSTPAEAAGDVPRLPLPDPIVAVDATADEALGELRQPDGTTKTVRFDSEEGTWMSVDIAGNGDYIVFDLLGHIYRLPPQGGDAINLTRNSGPALNFQPRISPDGRTIAFISDRLGQENLWIMDADGRNARPVKQEGFFRHREPAWSPDGSRVLVSRHDLLPFGNLRMYSDIWSFDITSGAGRRLVSTRAAALRAPSMHPDARTLYFYSAFHAGNASVAFYDLNRIQVLNLETGQRSYLHDQPIAANPERNPAYGLAGESKQLLGVNLRVPELGREEFSPIVSPDGKYLAYATQDPSRTVEYRNHRYGPATVLVLRTLGTGAEKVLPVPLDIDLSRVTISWADRVLPAFAWTGDSRALIVAAQGKIRRVDAVTGSVEPIPFRAPVSREVVLPERPYVPLSDDQVEVRSPLWPAMSPDRSKIVFVAVGRLWIRYADGDIRSLPTDTIGQPLMTPSWSRNSRRIVFASGSGRTDGHIWSIAADGGDLRRLTHRSGRYIAPFFDRSGNGTLFAESLDADSPEAWHGWSTSGRWRIVYRTLNGESAHGAERTLAVTNAYPYAQSPDGGAYFYVNGDGPAKTLMRGTLDHPNDGSRPFAELPEGTGFLERFYDFEPRVSPDGRYVALTSGQRLFVADLNAAVWRDGGSNPPAAQLVYRQIGTHGAHPEWLDGDTLSYGVGNVLVTYDLNDNSTHRTSLALTVPKPARRGSIGLRNARLITMEDSGVVERGDVIIAGRRIACVGRCGDVAADVNLDLDGKVVMPGLVDNHGHHTGASLAIPGQVWRLHCALSYGVTSIRDPASDSRFAFPMADLVEMDLLRSPRIFSTGEPVYPFGGQADFRTPQEAAEVVEQRVSRGATAIKNYRLRTRRQQQQLIAAARKANVPIVSEGGYLVQLIGMAIDGHNQFEHFIAPIPVYSDVSRFLGGAGVVYSPTVIESGHNMAAQHYFRQESDLLFDRKYEHCAPRLDTYRRSAFSDLAGRPGLANYSFPFVAEGVADLRRHGASVVIGEHGNQPGIGSHWEIWAYSQALDGPEVLEMATINGARAIGIDRDVGSLRAGKLADLLVLNADPLADIHNTIDIAYVVKDGRIHSDESLDVLYPEPEETQSPPWLHHNGAPETP